MSFLTHILLQPITKDYGSGGGTFYIFPYKTDGLEGMFELRKSQTGQIVQLDTAPLLIVDYKAEQR